MATLHESKQTEWVQNLIGQMRMLSYEVAEEARDEDGHTLVQKSAELEWPSTVQTIDDVIAYLHMAAAVAHGEVVRIRASQNISGGVEIVASMYGTAWEGPIYEDVFGTQVAYEPANEAIMTAGESV